MSSIRYAVIGAWGHLGVPLDALSRTPDAQAIALAPGSPEDDMAALQRTRPHLAPARIYSTSDELLAEAEPDLVIISTRLDRITPVARQVAKARCHMICEKPLAIDLTSLEALQRSVTDAGIQCVPMLHNRTDPMLAAAMAIIQQGRIGDVALINARKSYKWGTRPDWFGARQSYGGTIPWIGIHALDFIDALSAAAWESVYAAHANIAHAERPDCEDACTLIVRFTDGASATASIDFLRPASAPSHGDDWVRVVGSEGVLEVNMARREGQLIDRSGVHIIEPLHVGGPYDDLFAALLGRRPHDLSATQRGFYLTRAALLARESADTARPVRLT
jgi:predicted dehydrogenase